MRVPAGSRQRPKPGDRCIAPKRLRFGRKISAMLNQVKNLPAAASGPPADRGDWGLRGGSREADRPGGRRRRSRRTPDLGAVLSRHLHVRQAPGCMPLQNRLTIEYANTSSIQSFLQSVKYLNGAIRLLRSDCWQRLMGVFTCCQHVSSSQRAEKSGLRRRLITAPPGQGPSRPSSRCRPLGGAAGWSPSQAGSAYLESGSMAAISSCRCGRTALKKVLWPTQFQWRSALGW